MKITQKTETCVSLNNTKTDFHTHLEYSRVDLQNIEIYADFRVAINKMRKTELIKLI